MNSLDAHILENFGRLAGRSSTFDNAVVLISDSSLLKGAVVVSLVWWVWFADDTEGVARQVVLASLVACGAAAVVARGLASVLPFRERPVYTPGFDFLGLAQSGEIPPSEWSSFPSDNAALFFALATGLWVARRPFGILAFAYAALAICLPRAYLGLHWPTDLLAGALVGIGIGWLGTRRRVATAIGTPLLNWRDRYPSPFYAAMFVVCFEIATLFEDSRNIVSWGIAALRAL